MFCSLRGVAGYADRPMSGGHAPRPTRPAIPPDSPFSQADGVRQAGIPAARGLGAAGSARGARVLRGGTRDSQQYSVALGTKYDVQGTPDPAAVRTGGVNKGGQNEENEGSDSLKNAPALGRFSRSLTPLVDGPR